MKMTRYVPAAGRLRLAAVAVTAAVSSLMWLFEPPGRAWFNWAAVTP
jgi:hypothetical protein